MRVLRNNCFLYSSGQYPSCVSVRRLLNWSEFLAEKCILKKNFGEAMKWLNKAAARDSFDALKRLGIKLIIVLPWEYLYYSFLVSYREYV